MSDGTQQILVFNSGSSSLKLSVFEPANGDERLVIAGEFDGIGRQQGEVVLTDAAGKELLHEAHAIGSQEEAIGEAVMLLGKHLPQAPAVVGHRVVHGGPHLRDHSVITADVLKQLEDATHLAPLHIPSALRIIRRAQQLYPQALQVACFDTTFHKSMPPVATHLPLPSRYFQAGVQRYGFHGLSCESVLSRVPAPRPARIVIAHLGGGSSVTAVRDGHSVDTSMSFSPTGGIPMSIRSGDLDPSIVLYMMRTEGLSVDQVETLVNHQCGMQGLANGESDMQALLARTDDAARLAVDVFTTAVKKTIGGYIALLGGIDRMIFTGGIGQHSAEIRRRVLDGLEVFGLKDGSPAVLAVAADEEIQIARHCRALASQQQR